MENQQELMYKLQMFEQQMQQIQQQIQAVEQGIVDLSQLNLGLDELVGKKDQEVMTLVGKGIFVKTKLLSEELIVDVGGKNFITKSIPNTKDMIADQIEKLKEAKEILTENMEKSSAEFQEMIMQAQGQEQGCGHEHKEGECCGGENHKDGEGCGCEKNGKCNSEEKKE